VAAAVVLAIALVLLTMSLSEPQQSGADRAQVLGLPVGVVGVALAAISVWLGWKALQRSPSSVEVAGRLMKQVRAERRQFIQQALGVDWETDAADVAFTNPKSGSLPAAMEELLVNYQYLDGSRAGSIVNVSDFYRRIKSGRLVVLGAPGAGKSMLLSHLVRDLIDGLLSISEKDWPGEWRVPVMLSLPGCDLGDPAGTTGRSLAARFDTWIVERLVEDYGIPHAQAKALVSDQRILPVLDGLDEMDPAAPGLGTPPNRPHAVTVIQALNAQWAPVVLACRDLEYRTLGLDGAASGASARPRLLTAAPHIVLQPLPAQDIIDYLTDRFSRQTGDLPKRWQPVAKAIKARKSVLSVLENPWQLFLTVTAYGPETSDPAKLIRMAPADASQHLLSTLIPAVTDRDDTAEANGWTAVDVQRWLTSVAVVQYVSAIERMNSLTGIRLPELWRIGGRRYPRWIPPIITAALTLYTIFANVRGAENSVGTYVIGALLLAGALLLVLKCARHETPMRHLDLSALRTPHGRRRL
jgi:hypothetical protein